MKQDNCKLKKQNLSCFIFSNRNFKNNFQMKKIIFGACLLFLSAFSARSQGLDSVIIEKYYVSNAADSVGSAAASAGWLPVNSTAYRVFVDMKPGYKFQALYGTQDVNSIPLHTLLITTSTKFFNNEDRGDVMPDNISVTNTKKNTVMIDSWLSVGATATGEMGVLKSEDTDGTVGNTNGLLTNNDPSCDGPVTGVNGKDGMLVGSPKTVTTVGLSANNLAVFNNVSMLGDTFITTNGSVASLYGSVGPTATNRVLVGQFTTTGTLCWELNVQIKDTVNNIVENWVAKNPTGQEMTHSSLMGCISNSIPISVKENNPVNPAFSIYPNPSSSSDVVSMQITSTSGGKTSYGVYDLIGKQMLYKELGSVPQNYVEKINISSLSPGMYILKVTIDGNSSSQQLIKN